jgi:hypothetical protein
MTDDERVELSQRTNLYIEAERRSGQDTAYLAPYKMSRRWDGLQINDATGRVFFYHRVRVPVIECTSDHMAMDLLQKLRIVQVLDTLARI